MTVAPLRDKDLVLVLDQYAVHPVHHVPTYHFHMEHAESLVELGNIRFRVGHTPHVLLYAGHIGYNVHPAHRGHHYAARALTLLKPLAQSHGINPLWITCDPDNLASRRTLELAGAEFVEIVDVPEDCIIRQSGHPQKCRYRLPTA